MSLPRFNSVLVANRGEIACRVIRSAQALGYRTIAVYSAADQGALHTQLADQAIAIGSAPASQSYLMIENILAAARQSGAQAIHPGYGFLSENAEFARACAKAGLVFIGPAADAIDLMGNKAAAKDHMQAANVPCVPGYQGDQAHAILLEAGSQLGVPLMVKAAAGGGGRGMRLVTDLSQLPDAIKLASAEAKSAFGSAELILEKAIVDPRHVEVQVFGDEYGNVVHMGERDCSVQRRHQKVIEESPCPIMTPQLREEMGAAAVSAAQSIDYVGAGTVEFLLDSSGEFYFLEMNTRLQVEHPVTEMVTGLDLVALQLRVAQGQALGIDQSEINLSGHAIEVRLYTEDPGNDFLPSSGQISLWQVASEEGVRFDSGIVSGDHVSPFYDPMIAKVIAHGADRETARRKLIRALQRTSLFGVANNKYFLINCLEKDTFVSGEATTAFIQQEFGQQAWQRPSPSLAHCAIAAVLDLQLGFEHYCELSLSVVPELQHWSSATPLTSHRQYHFGERVFDLAITYSGSNFSVVDQASGEQVNVNLDSREQVRAQLSVNSDRYHITYQRTSESSLHIGFNNLSWQFVDQYQQAAGSHGDEHDGHVNAPMHGLVTQVCVSNAEAVSKGDKLLVLEAMKMQHEILAPIDGEVSELNVSAGQQVAADDAMLVIQP